MSTESSPIVHLSEDQSLDFLRKRSFGRLAVILSDEPRIFPINYAAVERTVYFRTAEGSKLFAAALGKPVAFEVDQVSDGAAMSVVVRGLPRIVTDDAEAAAADAAGLEPWIPTRKANTVAIELSEISGRRFTFGKEPKEAPLEPAD